MYEERNLHPLDAWLKRIIGCATGKNGIDKQITRVVGILTVLSVEKRRWKEARVSSVSGGLLLELSEGIL